MRICPESSVLVLQGGVYKRSYSCAYNPLNLGAYNPVIQFLSENRRAYKVFKFTSRTKKGVPIGSLNPKIRAIRSVNRKTRGIIDTPPVG